MVFESLLSELVEGRVRIVGTKRLNTAGMLKSFNSILVPCQFKNVLTSLDQSDQIWTSIIKFEHIWIGQTKDEFLKND